MKKQDISSKKNIILSSINNSRLHDAFKHLRSFSEAQMTWEVTDEINNLEQSYRYMLDYAMRGVADPSRQKVYNGIIVSLMGLLDRLERHALTPETATLYYNTLRYHNQQGKKSIPTLLREYMGILRENDLINIIASDRDEREALIKRESKEQELFKTIWISSPLSRGDFEALSEALKDDTIPAHTKRMIVSAALLGSYEYYDSRKLQLIIEAYSSTDDTLSAEALIAMILILYKYRERPVDSAVESRVKLITEDPRWHNDLKDAFLEIVRARDTERISRKMQEEVVPQMMKLRPEIAKKFTSQNGAPLDVADLDENPQWQEMLEKSGIADKMKELFEIQLEGGDVFMSTFAHLKAFPFFNEIGNWFMPFHTDHSVPLSVPDELSDISRMLETAPVFCNSDKFSFVLSLQSIPQGQRELMKSQLNSQVDAMLEMQNASLTNRVTSRRNVMNRYVQDLYRFFKLFRRKAEFDDPFITDLNGPIS